MQEAVDVHEDSGLAEAVYVSTDGQTFPTARPMWCAPDGGHLNLNEGTGLVRSEVNAGERSLWRYAKALRVDSGQRISLGEGWTPLVPGSWKDRPVQYKLEYFAPTGSFKDRGSSVMLTYLRGVGVTRILEDSSGNAGASLAAYCSAAGMGCRVLAPASAPAGKVLTIKALGADVRLVEGSRQDVAEAALKEAGSTFYASHNWQPHFLEGTKTLAFELWEQSGFTAPAAVIVPLGYGSNVLGLWLGFNELLARGQIEAVPPIFAVQAENCASFAKPWASGSDEWEAFDPAPTMADGIASVQPVRFSEVLAALRGSGGELVTVSEAEIATALKGLFSKGLFVEPTCATAAAACTRLQESGRIDGDLTPVIVLTGSGLKATDRFAEIFANSVSEGP